MELRKSSILMISAPAIAAFLVGAIVAGPLLNTTNKFGEALKPTGYVTISVVRDGNEIYHYEDHNLITEDGVEFLFDQVFQTPASGTNATWIALTTNATAPDDDDSTLPSEITTGGLERALGTVSGVPTGFNHNDDNIVISKTFTASQSHTGVQRAGLFTASSGGTMFATNTFSSVNLASGDQLTITWTIDLGLTLS